MRLRAALLLLPALVGAGPASAQAPRPRPLVVMNLAAHPDDEDGATMAYYRGHENAVVYSVVYTRGEGGQNEIGPDLYERLGVIRTAETEAAARILGTQVHYLNFYDFGFTKWAHEAFSEWSRPRRGFWDTGAAVGGEAAGRDAVTARLVYLIRRLKPDVLFTNHDTVTVGPRRQHGQHQAVGLSAWEAFARAADPAYHPEQFREPGLALWQPRRLFVRQPRPAEGYAAAVPVAAPCGGETCGDRAVRAAVLHRSQGFDLLAPRFFRRDTTYFVLYRAAAGAPPLPPGATDLAAGLPPRPEALSLPLRTLVDFGWVRPLAPLRVGAPVAVPGQEVEVAWGEAPGRRQRLAFLLDGRPEPVAEATRGRRRTALRIPPDAPPSFPFARYLYDRPAGTPPFAYHALQERQRLLYDGRGGDRIAPSGYGRIAHAGYLPLVVAPPVVVDLAPAPVRLVQGENVVPIAVRTYDPAARAVRVTLRVERPGGLVLHETTQPLTPADTAVVFRFTLDATAAPGPARAVVEAVAEPTSAPAEPYVETRPAALLPEIHVAEGLRVGFVRSYDATTEDALRAMGAEVVTLDSAALADGRFDGLHTIVLDIRAYLARPDLRAHNGRLLDWVRRGGHLVVGYQKTFEWNPGAPDPTQPEESGAVNPDFAPYPLVLGRHRVVREDAPVEALDPGHPVFTAPHAVTPDDWAGWVQERGLYFPETYDARYHELVATSDPGEDPLRGGLLLAGVGAGTYLYSPLAWYRQLEALNPGAWRLFANLVSLPLTDGRTAPGTR
jgi:LmbE family N-acetylglucosaminyl deacetylase